MPMLAADLLEAVAFTNIRVEAGSAASLLLFQISTFNDQWATNFNPAVESDRPVRNWIVPGRITQINTPASGNSQQRQAVINSTIRPLFAADAAFTSGRITTAQRDAMLSAWNASFGSFP